MGASLFVILVLLLSFAFKLPGQVYQSHSNITGIGRGAYAKATSLFAPISNPASLLHVRVPGVEIYSEKHLSVKEISRIGLSFQTPVRNGIGGINILHFNSPHFKETRFALLYGMNLGKCEIGISIGYMRIGMNGYGSDAAFSYEAGTLLSLTNTVRAGIVIANSAGDGFSQTREKLPFSYAFGIGYRPGKAVGAEIELKKTQELSTEICATLFYNINDSFQAAIGSNVSSSNGLYVSAGWKKNQLRVLVTVRYHQHLSYMPGLTLQYLKSSPDEI